MVKIIRIIFYLISCNQSQFNKNFKLSELKNIIFANDDFITVNGTDISR